MDDPEFLESVLESGDDETMLDLDKSWHGVHWLLTGSAEPTAATLSDAILGGDGFGEDLGYGPPRLLSSARVRSVAAALEATEIEGLRARMDPAAMTEAEIYPEIWDEEDIFDEYLAPSLEELRGFYAAAAAANQVVIQTLC